MDGTDLRLTRRGLVGAGIGGTALARMPSAVADSAAPHAVLPRDRRGPRSPRRPTAAQGTLFVSPRGSNRTGDGSKRRPWRTLERAYRAARPGEVVLLRGGRYPMAGWVTLDRRATREQPIVISSHPGEWAVLDFGGADGSLTVDGARWHVVRDLEIRNSPGQGLMIDGSRTRHNSFVNLVARDSNGSGFQIYRGSHQRFFECLAVFTRAPDVPGDADGFGSCGRGGPSSHNQFYRCVSVDAPDDGFDGWEGDHGTWVACWAIRAGRHGGNGNGFKAGPGPGAPNTIWSRVPPAERRNRTDNQLHFNVAVDCVETGFDSNGGTDIDFLHNTGVGNKLDFALYPVGPRTRGSYLARNNLAGGGVYLERRGRQVRNSWNLGLDVGGSDFVSTAVPPTSAFLGLTGSQAYRLLTRGSATSLLRLRRGSEARGAGARVGFSFAGRRPDLGAFEVGLPR